MHELKTLIKSKLASHQKRVIHEITQPEGYKPTPAAVLIPLFEKDGAPHLLFTQRTNRVATHKGQISFPGGAKDESDRSLLETALRESDEEVGIRPDDVEIIGELDDLITVTDFIVTPFVGIIPHPYTFKPNHVEIEELIEVPLSFFLDPKNLRTEQHPFRGPNITVYYFDYGKHTIWGVTGRIMKGFVDICSDPRINSHDM